MTAADLTTFLRRLAPGLPLHVHFDHTPDVVGTVGVAHAHTWRAIGLPQPCPAMILYSAAIASEGEGLGDLLGWPQDEAIDWLTQMISIHELGHCLDRPFPHCDPNSTFPADLEFIAKYLAAPPSE